MGHNRRGITLVEVMVVFSVVCLLIALTIPAIQHVRALADKTACAGNLRQIGIAMHNCQATRGRLFPRQWVPDDEPLSLIHKMPPIPEGPLSWMALLLPEIEKDPLYGAGVTACAVTPDPFVNPPHIGLATVVPVFTCRIDDRLRSPLMGATGIVAAYTSYIGIEGVHIPDQSMEATGVLGMGKPSIDLILDGASNTIMVGERPPPDPPLAGWWYPRGYSRGCHGPNNVISLGSKGPMNCDACVVTSHLGPGRLDNPCDRYHLWSLHRGGANILFADASVRFLRHSADPIMPALITVNGGEPVELPD